MFRPAKMAKIRAVCLKAAAPQVVSALHQLAVLHITDSKMPELERAGPLPSYDEISSRHVKVRTIIEAFGKEGKQPKKKQSFSDPLAAADELAQKAEQVFALSAKRDHLLKELDANETMQKALSEIGGLDIPFPELSSPALQFLLLRTRRKSAKTVHEILAATKNCAFTSTPGWEADICLIALPKSADAKFLDGLGQVMPLPQIAGTPKGEIAALSQKEALLREELADVGKKFSRLAETLCPQAVALEEALSIEADRAQVATLFSASSQLYFLEGWVEEAKGKKAMQELKNRFGKKIHLSLHPHFPHDELPPTLYNNPKAAKPFEFLVEFISTPQYYEIDPTILLAVAVPITYALIMGDAGYATISFLLAWFLTTKSKPGGLLHSVSLIWMISAVPAFIAGIVFDEYFGFTHSHLLGFQMYEGLHRAVSLTFLMFLSIMIGMVQLALGFILGAMNEWNHSRKHAYAKLCWLGVEIFGFMLIGSTVYAMFPGMAIPSGALLALCIGGLVYTEGVISIIELPSLLGNVMSYLRIAAVGVGGLIIAEAINELLLPRLELSPIGIVAFLLAAIIYVAMHLAACGLAMFESLVHGARLSVVEFFGKFYKGGGMKFAPFLARRVHTQEA